MAVMKFCYYNFVSWLSTKLLPVIVKVVISGQQNKPSISAEEASLVKANMSAIFITDHGLVSRKQNFNKDFIVLKQK